MPEYGPDMNKLYTSYKGFSFVTPSLSASQLAWDMIYKTNGFLEKHPYIEISFFVAYQDLPIITPQSAIYQLTDLTSSNDILIATDPYSWHMIQPVLAKAKYYYIYDMMLLKYVPPIELQQMKNSKTIFIARSKDHREFINKNLPMSVHHICENFDIEQMAKIVGVLK